MRHAIVATADGSVYEIYFSPKTGKSQTLLGTFPGIAKISAFYVPTDAFFNRRVLVVTSDKKIYQIKFSPQSGMIRTLLLNAVAANDVGGFYSDDDQDRHAIIATASGVIQEQFYDERD
jgi:hypothetical protein